MKTEVVLISTPGIGNLVPVVEFARRLTDVNPHLSATILVMTLPQRLIVNAYVEFQASSSSSTNIRFIYLPPVLPPSPDEYQTSLAFLCLFIEKHKLHVKDAIINLISSSPESSRVAGLFVDMFCTSMIDVANEQGVPCYLYFASPATFLSFMLHLPKLDSEIETEFEESGTDFIIPGFSHPLPPCTLPSLVLKRELDAYFWILHHAKRYAETNGIVVNTFQELEPYALESLSNNSQGIPVYATGPVLDLTGPTQWHPEKAQYATIMKWLDDQQESSVVFLCFGSMGSLGVAQIREIAFGLEEAGYRFLWSLREPPKGIVDLPGDYTNPEDVLPDGFLERTRGMGLVCGLAPQVKILEHKAIGGFVSHCGWNSILESIWHGVPIATWPIYAEQQMNAFEMVKELGLAVEIRLDYRAGSKLVSGEELMKGIKRVMEGDDEVRSKVKEMSQKSRLVLTENGSSFASFTQLIHELTTRI